MECLSDVEMPIDILKNGLFQSLQLKKKLLIQFPFSKRLHEDIIAF